MSLLADPIITVFDESGNPGAFYSLFFYASGTATPKTVYSDALKQVAHPNPLIADAAGRFPAIWLDGSYKLVFKNELGAEFRVVDPVESDESLRVDLANASDSALGSALVGYKYPGTGAVGTTVYRKLNHLLVDAVADFGAATDGVTVTSAAIQLAIDAVFAAGGGTVTLPAGTFMQEVTTGALCLALKSGVRLMGAGVGNTILKLRDGGDGHVINAAATVNCSVERLTIDGNMAAQTLGIHGIRGDTVNGFLVRDVEVKNTRHYGISLVNSNNRHVRIQNVRISNVGGDGIDMKNTNGDNYDINISDVHITGHGQIATAEQAGIDCRGPVKLSRITVDGFADNNVGIRFHFGTSGAKYSSLSQFYIAADNQDTTQGVYVADKDVSISDGVIFNCFWGVRTFDVRTRVTNVINHDCLESFVAAAATFGDGPRASHQASFFNCVASYNSLTIGTRGFRIASGAEVRNARLIGCHVTNADIGVSILANALNTQLIGGEYAGNTAAISDAGTGTTQTAVTV